MSPELQVALIIGLAAPVATIVVAFISRRTVSKTHRVVTDVQEQIKTNHGSRSIGDAIDRVTEVVWAIERLAINDSARLTQVEASLRSQGEAFAMHELEAEERDRMLAEHAALLREHRDLVDQRVAPTLERTAEALEHVKEALPDATSE